MKGVITVPRAEQTNGGPGVYDYIETGAKVGLWWLRHYETTIRFWTGFSWVWVIGTVLSAVVGHLDLGHALCIILLIGVIANTGIYLSIRTMASYLKGLEDGPEKKEAHELMIKIIKRRMLYLC
jgi:hypothetical protein